MNGYKTLLQEANDEYIVNKSRFIGSAHPREHLFANQNDGAAGSHGGCRGEKAPQCAAPALWGSRGCRGLSRAVLFHIAHDAPVQSRGGRFLHGPQGIFQHPELFIALPARPAFPEMLLQQPLLGGVQQIIQLQLNENIHFIAREDNTQ